MQRGRAKVDAKLCRTKMDAALTRASSGRLAAGPGKSELSQLIWCDPIGFRQIAPGDRAEHACKHRRATAAAKRVFPEAGTASRSIWGRSLADEPRRGPLVYRHSIDATTYTLRRPARPPRQGDAAALRRPAGRHRRRQRRADDRGADGARRRAARRSSCRKPSIPYEADEVTRLIIDSHDARAFAPVASLTVGGFRDWLLSDAATPETLRKLAPGITPEMAAAVSQS